MLRYSLSCKWGRVCLISWRAAAARADGRAGNTFLVTNDGTTRFTDHDIRGFQIEMHHAFAVGLHPSRTVARGWPVLGDQFTLETRVTVRERAANDIGNITSVRLEVK
jgi:hypothetical protein